jgi:uncharacterized surface protein with fasciclin (FAS1) repeats
MSFQEGTNRDQTVTATVDQKNATKDLFETLKKTDAVGAFARAVEAAGLQITFASPRWLTVFAPTDDALSRVPGWSDLLKDRARLAEMMNTHVLPGRFTAADLRLAKALKTASGNMIHLSTEDRVTRVQGANLLRTDIACTNGIVHVVDSVLHLAGRTRAGAERA